MARLFLSLTFIGLCGLFVPWAAVLDLGRSEPGQGPAATAPVGWMGGLLLGLALAWLYRIGWSGLRARFGVWLRLQRRRLAWALLGSICVAILIYF